ncbi:MAG: alpha/beta fold hydrolase [Gaiellaceae bacterium]
MSIRGGSVAIAEPVVGDQRTPAQRAMDERDWSFGGAWPYAPKWHHTDGVRLHYVDEGPRDAAPVVMLHGNPTWAFLYRKMIACLGKRGQRTIAPDQLGFGRSDKPHRLREYSLARHCRLFDALLDELALDDVILVAHDWGGPVAMSWASRHPERVSGLVLLNTFIEPPPSAASVARRILVKGAHRTVHRAIWADPVSGSLTSEERRAYAAPHPSWDSRTGILAFEQAHVRGRAVETKAATAETRAGLDALRATPTLIGWGAGDATLAPELLSELRDTLPGAQVRELDGVGHLVPEAAAELFCDAILELRNGRRVQ